MKILVTPLIKSIKKYDSVKLLLISLKWLPVWYRIMYETLIFVFKALHNQAPLFMSNMLSTSPRSLRSENQHLLSVSRRKKTNKQTNKKKNHKGNMSLLIKGLKLWNDLPDCLC